MANQKISDLTEATDCDGSELVAVVQGGVTKKAPLSTRIKAYFDTLYATTSQIPKYAKLSDVKTAGTQGGSFSSGAWRTRTINTEDTDADSIVTLSSNQFTLQAGTYRIKASAPATYVNGHQAKLRNTSDSADTILGTSEYASTADISLHNTRSIIAGQFTIAGTKTFEIQHCCETTNATQGFGSRANCGVSEVYTIVEIWKVA